MRILLFGERLSPPLDEGIKNYTLNLLRALREAGHEVLALTCFAEGIPDLGVENVPANPLLLSLPLWRKMRAFHPDCVIYVPTACATPFSFARSRVLRLFAGGKDVLLVALQVRRYGRGARLMMPILQPERVLVQSERTKASLVGLCREPQLLPPAVDLTRFAPVTAERKRALRAQYQLGAEDYIVLHVGHLNRGRNVQALAGLQREGVQVLVAGSTSTPQDGELVHELERAGVKVITGYLPNVAELYQVADCYVFPVLGENSAIDLPLSVLEALACDVPVVATRFAGLVAHLPEGPGLRYVDDPAQLPEAVEAMRQTRPSNSRERVLGFGWEGIVRRMVSQT